MNQNEQLLTYLLAGNVITQPEARALFGIHRLGARAHDLRRDGHEVVTAVRSGDDGKPVVEYRLTQSHARRFGRHPAAFQDGRNG